MLVELVDILVRALELVRWLKRFTQGKCGALYPSQALTMSVTIFLEGDGAFLWVPRYLPKVERYLGT